MNNIVFLVDEEGYGYMISDDNTFRNLGSVSIKYISSNSQPKIRISDLSEYSNLIDWGDA